MNKEIKTGGEFRTIENGNGELVIEGYAVRFNSPATWNVYGSTYTEIIDSSALDETDMKDVVLRYNHNDTFIVLARTRNKSLELIKDTNGLKIRATLQKDITDHVNIYNAIKSGLIDKQSFGFTIKEQSYDYETDTRTILKIDKLFDVSVVDQPFYDSTDVSVARKNEVFSFMETRAELRKKHEELVEYKKNLISKLG